MQVYYVIFNEGTFSKNHQAACYTALKTNESSRAKSHLVDKPTRGQNVVLVDKKSQLVDTRKSSRRHPKSQPVDKNFVATTVEILISVYDLTFFSVRILD